MGIFTGWLCSPRGCDVSVSMEIVMTLCPRPIVLERFWALVCVLESELRSYFQACIPLVAIWGNSPYRFSFLARLSCTTQAISSYNLIKRVLDFRH